MSPSPAVRSQRGSLSLSLSRLSSSFVSRPKGTTRYASNPAAVPRDEHMQGQLQTSSSLVMSFTWARGLVCTKAKDCPGWSHFFFLPALGSECSGGINNVLIANNRFTASVNVVRIKACVAWGGNLTNITYTNSEILAGDQLIFVSPGSLIRPDVDLSCSGRSVL